MSAPKQKGFILLSRGSLGESTFAKTSEGNIVKEKKASNKNKWKKNDSYIRCRENAAEFGSASTAAKLIRKSVNLFIGFNTDAAMVQQLNRCLSRIIKLDPESAPGKRMPTAENIKLLIGFEMNSTAGLKPVFNSRFRTTANRQSGEFGIIIPSFIPAERVKAPKGTTHFIIVSAASSIDFSTGHLNRQSFTSELMPWNEVPTAGIDIIHALTPGITSPIFLFLGLEFYQDSPEGILPVSARKKNPLCIVNIITD